MKKTLLSTMLLASVAVAPVAMAQVTLDAPSFIGKASATGEILPVESVTINGTYNIDVTGNGTDSGDLQKLNISGIVYEPTSKESSKGNTTTISFSANKTSVKNSTFLALALGANATTKGYTLGTYAWTTTDTTPPSLVTTVVAYKKPTKSAPGEIIEVPGLLVNPALVYSVTSGKVVDKTDSSSTRLKGFVPVDWSFQTFGGLTVANISFSDKNTSKSSKQSARWTAVLRAVSGQN